MLKFDHDNQNYAVWNRLGDQLANYTKQET